MSIWLMRVSVQATSQSGTAGSAAIAAVSSAIHTGPHLYPIDGRLTRSLAWRKHEYGDGVEVTTDRSRPAAQGQLRERPVPRLIQQLFRKRVTGSLVVTDGDGDLTR